MSKAIMRWTAQPMEKMISISSSAVQMPVDFQNSYIVSDLNRRKLLQISRCLGYWIITAMMKNPIKVAIMALPARRAAAHPHITTPARCRQQNPPENKNAALVYLNFVKT